MDTLHGSPSFFAGIVPSRMICLAAGTILLYDHLTTLDQEINLVWRRRLGTYGTACFRWDIAACILIAFSIVWCEVILVLRTWALWNMSGRILGFFGIVACAKVPLAVVGLYKSIHSSHYLQITDRALPSQFICISPMMGNWSWETLVFVAIMITETAIASLTIIRAIEGGLYFEIADCTHMLMTQPSTPTARKSASQWYFRIHYMGVIYYVFTLDVMSLVRIRTKHLEPRRSVAPSRILPFGVLQAVIQSTLCNRVIFLAREPSDLGVDALLSQTIKSTFVCAPAKTARSEETDTASTLNARGPVKLDRTNP
ncbi:hypothetical protein NP233_g9744 [Leucocoprinus birnbaumii]|uniref:DUF6533 domain-containing protein n=1 Tax=Leucocoprinus birnbaumii TaxID=56174 RepID=A0AAD5YSJ8_9AGAR|nr:hypothetical protein NP233_g9744 [Leucocoprinus birnbaumii]